MDLPLLKAFVEVVRCGSVSQAAAALHLAQPSVSKRIAALEDTLGQPLFDRVGRRLLPTDAGRALLPHAERTLAEVEDGRRAVAALSGVVAGRLAIGTSHHIGLHRLPPVLRAFVQRHPAVDLDLQFMDSEVACGAVLAGRLELGIVTLPTEPLPRLSTRRIWPDPLAVVVAPSHALGARSRVELDELATHPAVLPDAATYTHRIIRAALERRGVAPRVRLSTNYLETLKMLVAIGLGWSVLPRSMIDRTLRPLAVRGLSMQRELGVVWHEKRTLSGAARALVAQLEAAA